VVLVCGGRDYADEDKIAEVLAELPSRTVLVHDGTKVGRLIRDIGRLFGFANRGYTANWSRLSTERSETLLQRNQQIFDENPDIDLVIAFSGGYAALDMTVRARRRAIPIQYVDWPPG
jgi:hypothetical protein